MPTYIPGNVDKYFYNRKKDIKKINNYLNILEDDVSEQLLLTGYRGVGKTFLLKKIMKDLNPNFLVCYMDISKINAENNGNLTEEKILLELLNLMNESLINIKDKHIEKIYVNIKNLFNSIKLKKYDFKNLASILEIPIPEIENNYEKLAKVVMEYPQKIVDKSDEIKGFVIIIDEFQFLKKLKNPESFFWLIRSHSQFQDNVSYIFTGSTSRLSDIVEMINGETGAFGGRMIQINIDPFTKEETKSYFKDKLVDVEMTEDGFEKFYYYTRGIPTYINSFYNIMDSSVTYDEKLIEETFLENMDQILVMWIRIWGTLHKYEKEIVLKLIENDTLTWTLLENKISFSKPTLNKYLTSLEDKGIVVYKNNEYYVEDKMLIRWLKHEKQYRGFYPI
ncbi:MAG: ATP-binding protein [Methanosphaera stadtmanae]|nr:ATP-binding protein [Methanosphaera stadtmanae]